MIYLTVEELHQITGIANAFQTAYSGNLLKTPLSMSCSFYDANGENVGTVEITEGGEYGFVPLKDNDEATQ